MDSSAPVLPSQPVHAGHTFTHVTGYDNSRLHLGDNHYKIGMRVVAGRLDVPFSDIELPEHHGAEQPEFTGHYSSTALRKVASYVPRPALHTQVKERLHDTLEERGPSCKILVICGLGGAGKSQLMLHYIEVFKGDYTAVFWVDAGSKDRLEADYKRIHNLLLHPSQDDADISTCVSEIRQWCQRKVGKHLFVLDSADSIEDTGSDGYVDLQSYIVDAASADMVITTRVQSAKDMTELEAVQVAELTPDEARDLFIRRMKLQSPDVEMQKEIDAVTAELGHFALAVSLAAAYVASTRRLKAHPANYLVEYAERKKVLLAREPKKHIDQYGESVLTTWETTHAAMFSQCPEACNLLTLIAFLNSSDIFPQLFGPDYRTASGILASVIWVQTSTMSLQETIDTSMETLELYSLLQWNEQAAAFSMHKLVHAWSIERLGAAQQAMFCLAAWHYLRYLVPVTETVPTMSERLASHTTACFIRVRALCQIEGLAAMPFVNSTVYLAGYLRCVGRVDHAYELHLFAHEYHKNRRSIDPMAYAKSLYTSARILQAQYKHQAAEEVLRQALDELKEHRSDESLLLKELCQCLLVRLLARHYRKLNELEQTLRQILSSPVDTRERARIDVMFQLARVVAMQSRYSEAEQILRQLMGMPEEISEGLHVSISRGLGQVLHLQGRYAEAETVIKHASENVLAHGPANLKSQTAMQALGEVKLAQKAYGEAASILRTACDAIATPYHRTHLECLHDLGYALRRLEDHEEAMLFYTKALEGHVQIHGADHQYTREISEEIDKYRAFLAGEKKIEEKYEHGRGVRTDILRLLGAGFSLRRRGIASSARDPKGLKRLVMRGLSYRAGSCDEDASKKGF
jgi:tetratricopeptide (TPR) repeat protein